MEKIGTDKDPIKLSALLKLCGAAETGGLAGILIKQGKVTVDGEVCTEKRKKIFFGQTISVDGREYKVYQI